MQIRCFFCEVGTAFLNVMSTKTGLFPQLHNYKIIHVGFEIITAVVMKCSVFRDIRPRSPLKVKGRLHLEDRSIDRAQLATCVVLVHWLAYSSTMKMEAIYSSETLVDFQRTTRRYILEAGTLQKMVHFLSLYRFHF
jgi:hypothetical protein